MTHYKNLLRYDRYFLQNKLFIIFLWFILSIIIRLIYYYVVVNSYVMVDIQFSITDFILLSGNPFLFYSNYIILPLFLVSFRMKYDFEINTLIRFNSRQKMYMKQILLIIIGQILISLEEYIFSFVLGNVFSNELINFNTKGSYFRFINGIQPTSISFFEVSINVFLSCLIWSITIMFIFLLVRWIVNHSATAIIVMLFFACVDTFAGHGVCSLLCYSHDNFFEYSLNNILIALIILICVVVVGMYVVSRKEFLNEKQF